MTSLEPVRPAVVGRRGDDILADLRTNVELFQRAVDAAYTVALAIVADLKEIYERQLFRRVWGYTSMEAFCQGEFGVAYNSIRHRAARVYRDRELIVGGIQPPGPSQLDRRDLRKGTGPDPSGRPPDKPPMLTQEEYEAVAEQQQARKRRMAVAPRPQTEQHQHGPRQRILVGPPLPTPGLNPQEAISGVLDAVAGNGTPARPAAAPGPSQPPEPVVPQGNPLIGWLCTLLPQLDADTVIDEATDAELEVLLGWTEAFIIAGRARSFCEHHPQERSPDGKVCTGCGRQVLA